MVYDNLKTSFPEKSEQEIRKIEKNFYKHLSDVFVEYLILARISAKEISKRYKFVDMKLIDDLYAENKDIVLTTGHYANWEWMTSFPLHATQYNAIGVYKPQSNKYFDRFLLKLRKRFGLNMVNMENTYRRIHSNKKKDIRSVLYMIADQLPPKNDMKFFTTFLNHEGTAFFIGQERIAKALDMPVVFANIDKIKRGKYEISFTLLTKEPKQTQDGEITEMFARHLEKRIMQKPEYWLWSHKRWKRTQKSIGEIH